MILTIAFIFGQIMFSFLLMSGLAALMDFIWEVGNAVIDESVRNR